MTPPVVDEKALLENEYQKLRYKIIRYGDLHPDSKEDLAWLVYKLPGAARGEIDTLAMLVERYRAIAHAPQPDLHKLIGQMEDFWKRAHDKYRQTRTSYDEGVMDTIDRCIALVRGMLS